VKILNGNNLQNVFTRRLKTLVLIAFLILVWVGIIEIFTSYLKVHMDDDWNEISAEKMQSHEALVLNLFNVYQNNTSQFSDALVKNSSLRRNVTNNDSRQVFDIILNTESDPAYQVEIYNKRLELLAYKGRQLEPEYLLMQRALNKQTLSIVKDIGFYTYIMVYSPIPDAGDTSQVSGVAVTANLLDIKYQIKNKFFPNYGITQDIYNDIGLNVELVPANSISGIIYIDSTRLAENRIMDLISINNTVAGKILLPKYDKTLHEQNIDSLSTRITSILIFAFSILFIIIFLKVMEVIDSGIIRLGLFGLLLVVIRYLWLQFSFPAGAFESEIFSPSYYASTFGFGIVKSIGELLVTSILFIAFALYSIYLIHLEYKRREFPAKFKFFSIAALELLIAVMAFFAVIELFGVVIQSIIFDSNLKFLDKAQVIPSAELFSIQLVILIISFGVFLIITSIALYILFHTGGLIKHSLIDRYRVIPIAIIFLGLNLLLNVLFPDIGINNLHRILIVVLIFAFAFLLYYKRTAMPSFSFFNLRNFSIIILICIIVIPLVMLEKITSQEQKYVELIGNKISENEIERINFLILNELTTQVNNKAIEENLRNNNKLPKLAFYLWADSKLNAENFNSAILLLDTNRKILSDFNINDTKLNTDSLSVFLNRNFFDRGYNTVLNNLALNKKTEGTDTITVEESEFEEEETETGETSMEDTTPGIEDEMPAGVNEEELPSIVDNIAVLENKNEKFYVGIAPIQKLDLKNTQFARILGYMVIAVHYESKNFLMQSSLEIFKNYTRDNTLDKLISKPVITEYLNGAVVSSTEPDFSTSSVKSVELFKEFVKNTPEKSGWRYEQINNEKYKSYYIIAEGNRQGDEEAGDERIYSISLKRDDIKLTSFYYLKFILFTIFIYLIFYTIFGLFYISRTRKIRLNFREKLFVSFFVVSVIPIILLALYTRGFIISKNETNLQNQIIADLSIFKENLVSKSVKGTSRQNPDSLKVIREAFLTRTIPQTEKNYNLFLKYNLISTTNEELYKSDLLDTRVDADAYNSIFYQKKDLFIETQDIGALSFLVGYKPFKDVYGNLAGIISLQLVYKQSELNEELTETLTYIFGTYFIVIIILLILVSFLTERISKPILQLQSATERLSKGDNIDTINIDRNDELADLVNSFNNMTRELEKSKEELKKAEREAAWRDIARRVAHEIKNPLTPMKLSIQHLSDIYSKNGKDHFPLVLNKTKELIINEIDKLNRIATEFSNFAKLPTRNYEPLKVNGIIEDVVSLYLRSPNIKFKLHLSEDTGLIMADKQELNRVFQNLVKNSIQSIHDKGTIEITSYKIFDKVYVEVKDTGCGMPSEVLQKLFEPNFSTKSSGMGLGLAISKKSLDDMKAEIHFESEVNKGTLVRLRFNAYNDKTETVE
jgi:signal transduction histidine kinase